MSPLIQKPSLPRALAIAGVLAGVSVAVLALIAVCGHPPTPLPPAERRTLDSLAITKPSFDSARTAALAAESAAVARSRVAGQLAARAIRTADSLRAVANQLAASALAKGDTATVWYRIAETRREENDSLRAANARLDTALTAQTTARLKADARADAADARRLATDDLNARLARDLARADSPCRVLWVARCPSRTQVAVASLALGFGVKVAYDKVRH